MHNLQRDSPRETRESKIHTVLADYIPLAEYNRLNKQKKWAYGYSEKHDMIVISKTGEIGEIYEIEGLIIALPAAPKKIHQRSGTKEEQYWVREETPKELQRIKSIHQWNGSPAAFKTKWMPYIDQMYEYRKNGFWFMNNGKETYITGSHWYYLQIAKIDIGYPDFREANRIKYIHWEACRADDRCYGQIYTKIRRSGHSFEASADAVEIATSSSDSQIGLLSKTLDDVKKMFTDKVVPINTNLPFYFKPIMEGMDKPKTVLSYAVPATKITKRNMLSASSDTETIGLNTTITYKSSEENAYDGEKLQYLSIDEAGKYIKPANIINTWRIHKTCLRLGGRIIGKCRMGSTVNAHKRGGEGFKKMVEESNVTQRNANGQTKSGLYSLFIPMEWNMEGFIDIYGMPVLRKPAKPVRGIDGRDIKNGAIDYWEAEVDSLKSDPDALNEFYRQFPRSYSHAFRDESNASLFNLTKIYEQIDYNDAMVINHHITRGFFHWKDGVKDSKVVFTPDNKGRFLLSWIPPAHLQNKVIKRGDLFYPGNEHIGSFGCDPYDISGVVVGRGSNGALHGMTKFHMEEGPVNEFFLEYIARPATAEIFFEDVLMATVFYGMPILIESNKPRLLYHFKNRGYRPFSINRPDKQKDKLSKTERELGGIPNNSEDVIQSHGAAIESYIEKHIGYDREGTYRDPDNCGSMLFNRTLLSWAAFEIDNRGSYDASISSGLCIMANQKHLYQPQQKSKNISINFAKYSNDGIISHIIKSA